MDDAAKSGLAEQIAGALDWWRLAGVDHAFDAEPARWISPAQPTALEAERLRAELRAAPPELRPHEGGDAEAWGTAAVDTSTWPSDLALFTDWWLAEPWLDDGRAGGRVPPRGRKGARLMVLVPEPERDDREHLLSGPQGRLLAAFLAAAGLGEDEVYVASALTRHTPMPDWTDHAARGFGRLLAHHVGLVRPERLIGFGEGVLSLLGNDPPNSAAPREEFAHEGFVVPLLRARSLDGLLARPAWKAELWRGWLEWTSA